MPITIAIVLHTLAVVVWVGGMFFAHMALRPAVATLPPEVRLPLLVRVFERFFPWVWASVLIILATGYGALFALFGTTITANRSVYSMMILGNLMTVLFLYVWFFPYRRLRSALAAQMLPLAALQQARIRHVIFINLILGILTIIIAMVNLW